MISFGGISIHFYGLLIGAAIWINWEIALKGIRKNNLDESYFNRIALVTVIGGIVGARAYHVIHYWSSYYSGNLSKIFFLWEGGMGIWGAIIGGVLFMLCYQYIDWLLYKEHRVDFLCLLDAIAIGLPIAQAVGRVGNLLNNELWGQQGEPLFLYEGLLDLFLFGVLFLANKKSHKPGYLWGVYLIGYGLIRLGLDHYRSPEAIFSIGGISVAIILSMIAILFGLGLIYPSLRKQV